MTALVAGFVASNVAPAAASSQRPSMNSVGVAGAARDTAGFGAEVAGAAARSESAFARTAGLEDTGHLHG